MQEYKLSLAVEEDVDTVASIFKQAFSEGIFSDTSLNEDKVKQVIRNLLLVGLVLVAKKDEEIVGIFLATTSELWFANNKVAIQVAWYILKEHRNKGLSNEMLAAYEYWARMNRCDSVSVMFLGTDLTKLFESKGFSRKETAFMKVL